MQQKNNLTFVHARNILTFPLFTHQYEENQIDGQRPGSGGGNPIPAQQDPVIKRSNIQVRKRCSFSPFFSFLSFFSLQKKKKKRC